MAEITELLPHSRHVIAENSTDGPNGRRSNQELSATLHRGPTNSFRRRVPSRHSVSDAQHSRPQLDLDRVERWNRRACGSFVFEARPEYPLESPEVKKCRRANLGTKLKSNE